MSETAFEFLAALVAAAMLAGLFVFSELGRWLGQKRCVPGVGQETEGGAIDASVFALFGLLIAFNISGALQRFDDRRTLIVDEADAIWTAYLRLDVIPVEPQSPIRALFRQYAESRLAFYRKMTDLDDAKLERERSLALQDVIWRRAVEAARTTGNPAVLTLVAAGLNSMFDIEAHRMATLRLHPPPAVFGMLFALGFASAFLVGYSTAGRPRNVARLVVFLASLALTVFMILNLEFPRLGLIRFGVADRPLVEVLERMR